MQHEDEHPEPEDQSASPVDAPAETGDGPDDPGDSPADTGEAAVDAVLRRLEDLDQTPVSEHVEVFEQAHQQLRRVLDGGHGG